MLVSGWRIDLLACKLKYLANPAGDSMQNFSNMDFIACIIFVCSWATYVLINDYSPLRGKGISWLMAEERHRWMLVMLKRELRIVDISIINGLQQGAAFYASFCILAIGGGFALLGSTENVLRVFSDLPISMETSRALWEIKILGFIAIYAYAFFKFGWSYRLFMYCSILVGGVMPLGDIATEEEMDTARRQSVKAANLNTSAARHFNAGQRGVFFSMGYLGWFVSPQLFIVGSILTLLVMLRRQFYSNSRAVVAGSGRDENNDG